MVIRPQRSCSTTSLRSERGFTLAEVAIAVALLGIGLTTLVTVQTRSLRTHMHEETLFHASLYAQYIMAFEEGKKNPPAVGSTGGDLADLLGELGYFQKLGDEKRLLQESLAGWRYRKTVTQRDFAQFEDVMREIELTVSWGDAGNENLRLVYAVPGGSGAPQQSPGTP